MIAVLPKKNINKNGNYYAWACIVATNAQADSPNEEWCNKKEHQKKWNEMLTFCHATYTGAPQLNSADIYSVCQM